MYVYPPGSGFSGLPKLVQPGDELFNETSQDNALSETDGSTLSSVLPQCSSENGNFCQRDFNSPLNEQDLEKLKYKNFSPETMKKVK